MSWEFYGARGDSGLENSELAVLVSQVVGFTMKGRPLGPEELARLLDEYLTAMHSVVLEHGGRLGCNTSGADAVIAVFGDGTSRKHASLAACRAALGMVRALQAFRPRWEMAEQRNRPADPVLEAV